MWCLVRSVDAVVALSVGYEDFFRRLSFFFQAEDGIRDWSVTGVQSCALPIYRRAIIDGGHHSTTHHVLFALQRATWKRPAPVTGSQIGFPNEGSQVQVAGRHDDLSRGLLSIRRDPGCDQAVQQQAGSRRYDICKD